MASTEMASASYKDLVAALPPTAHPLGPLTGAEIAAVVEMLRAGGLAHERTRFNSVNLEEPLKDTLLGWRPDQVLDRQALAIMLDNESGRTIEAVVSLSRGEILSHEHIPGAQPSITLDEFFECEAVVKRHPAF